MARLIKDWLRAKKGICTSDCQCLTIAGWRCYAEQNLCNCGGGSAPVPPTPSYYYQFDVTGTSDWTLSFSTTNPDHQGLGPWTVSSDYQKTYISRWGLSEGASVAYGSWNEVSELIDWLDAGMPYAVVSTTEDEWTIYSTAQSAYGQVFALKSKGTDYISVSGDGISIDFNAGDTGYDQANTDFFVNTSMDESTFNYWNNEIYTTWTTQPGSWGFYVSSTNPNEIKASDGTNFIIYNQINAGDSAFYTFDGAQALTESGYHLPTESEIDSLSSICANMIQNQIWGDDTLNVLKGQLSMFGFAYNGYKNADDSAMEEGTASYHWTSTGTAENKTAYAMNADDTNTGVVVVRFGAGDGKKCNVIFFKD